MLYCSVTSRGAVFCLHKCLTGDRRLFGRGPSLHVTSFSILTLPSIFSTQLSWALPRCSLPTNVTGNMQLRLGNVKCFPYAFVYSVKC